MVLLPLLLIFVLLCGNFLVGFSGRKVSGDYVEPLMFFSARDCRHSNDAL